MFTYNYCGFFHSFQIGQGEIPLYFMHKKNNVVVSDKYVFKLKYVNKHELYQGSTVIVIIRLEKIIINIKESLFYLSKKRNVSHDHCNEREFRVIPIFVR